MPPLDSATGTRDPSTGAFKGNHQAHAGTTAATCVKCHGSGVTSYTTSHRTKQIQMQQGNINGSPLGAAAAYMMLTVRT
jgi:cytochrome c553